MKIKAFYISEENQEFSEKLYNHLQILNYHHNILFLFHAFLHLNIRLQILIQHIQDLYQNKKKNILFLFHSAFHLYKVLQILCNNLCHILSLFCFFLHLNIHLQILNYHHNILLLFHVFSNLNIHLRILIYHHNYILFLFHFFLHLNFHLQILIYHFHNILFLSMSFPI